MKTRSLCFVLVVLLEGISVPSGADPAQVVFEGSPQPPSGVASRLDPESAYTPKRWIGLRPVGSDQCPKVRHWKGDPLLNIRPADPDEQGFLAYLRARKSRRAVDARRLRRLGLDRYCVYTPINNADVLFDPGSQSGLAAASPDRLASSVTSAGSFPSDLLSRTIWPVLATQFRNQTGQGSSVITGISSVEEPSVRLTFIDSQPTDVGIPSPPSPGQSWHGFTLIHFARDLVCTPSMECAATIASRQALSESGGHVGRLTDLATAIVNEVKDWRDRGRPRHLILNISLGWDGEMFHDLDHRRASQLDPPVKAVYDALRFARQSGALVIAAAGNRRGGTEITEWPLLPAAWELRRPTYFPFPLGRKPVYAVGGVDWQNLRLANSRDGGQPRRVAFADHAVTHVTSPDPTEIYTGTSVSAAIASSIAAVIWHLRPELKPCEVMRLVTRSGAELPAQADFYAWRELWPFSKLVKAPHLRRLSLCSAVARACQPDGRRCPGYTPPSACPAPVPSHELAKAVEGLGPLPILDFPTTPPDRSEIPYASSQRWLFPQPSGNPCPGCALVPTEPPGSRRLAVQIDGSWQKTDITGATLYIQVDGVQTEQNIYQEIMASMDNREVPHLIDVEDERSSSRGYRAWIDFDVPAHVDMTTAVENPVIVSPNSVSSPR